MTIELSEYVIDAIADAVVKKMQEPCEDAVSRQAVLEAIMANCIWENEYNLTSSRIKKAVESLPPFTPKADDVLDKIRAEIKALSPEPTAYDVVDGSPIKDAVWKTLADVLKIIDKYKAESEVEE